MRLGRGWVCYPRTGGTILTRWLWLAKLIGWWME